MRDVSADILNSELNSAGHHTTLQISGRWIWRIHNVEHRPEPDELLVGYLH